MTIVRAKQKTASANQEQTPDQQNEVAATVFQRSKLLNFLQPS